MLLTIINVKWEKKNRKDVYSVLQRHNLKGVSIGWFRRERMAHIGSKGWYVVKLKELGVTKHPIERRKLEQYKTYILRQLYEQTMEKNRISPPT